MPTALGPKTAAFYLLAFAAVFAMARAPRALTAFEKWAIVVLLVLAVEATRGVTWFVLFTLVVLPGAVGELRSPDLRHVAGSALTLGLALGALIIAGSRSSSWFTRDYPPYAARVVADAAGPNGAVFANGAFGDWLLFKAPPLRGRMAYDARFEVLPHGRLADAAAVSIGRWDAPRILRPFDVVVLRPQETELRDTLGRTGAWDRTVSDKNIVVLRRRAE
jgi:hypothetical protein